jgi:Mn2+/Fe2+ NRAMP family transporter
VLFWSVIAAAFIGPGTVTTAARAGSAHRFDLIWALVFSTLACLMLQEAGARVTIVSGRNLGQALRERYRAGAAAVLVPGLALGAILIGCAAYEAGNILGGVAGAALGTGASPRLLTVVTGALAALLLFFGAPGTVARLLSIFVAVMGVTFLVTAVRLQPPLGALARGAVAPVLPEGAGTLVLALIGTTVVPYNLFLGSGLARGQSLGEMRFGLAVSVLLGGLISVGILVVGTAVAPPFGFEALGEVLETRLGGAARALFAAGLFAAGSSSAITAPLAAAVTARSLLAPPGDARWTSRGWRFRAIWSAVLLVGVGFGLTDVRPIPAIVVAQALNGLLLPLVAVFLLWTVNDRALMGARVNGRSANAAFAAVVLVTLVLGLGRIGRAAASATGLPDPSDRALLAGAAVVALLLALPVGRELRRRRRRNGAG